MHNLLKKTPKTQSYSVKDIIVLLKGASIGDKEITSNQGAEFDSIITTESAILFEIDSQVKNQLQFRRFVQSQNSTQISS